MAYSIQQRRAKRNFRQDFPQLCPASTLVPLDYSKIKDIVEPVLPRPKTLPYGWVNLRDPSTYQSTPKTTHELMCAAVKKMHVRWVEHDRLRDHYFDYDNYDDNLNYDEEESEEESSLSAEDPDEYISD